MVWLFDYVILVRLFVPNRYPQAAVGCEIDCVIIGNNVCAPDCFMEYKAVCRAIFSFLLLRSRPMIPHGENGNLGFWAEAFHWKERCKDSL